MKLLKLENNNLCSITPEALGLQAFKVLWDRDKTKTKEKARLDLSFVYFYADWSSPFKRLPKEDKIAQLEKEVYDGNNKVDSKVLNACELYEKIQNEGSFSLKYLESVKKTATKISEYLESIDLDERDKQGRFVYNTSTLQKTISDIPETIKKIIEMEKRVEAELSQEANIRGGANKNPFED